MLFILCGLLLGGGALLYNDSKEQSPEQDDQQSDNLLNTIKQNMLTQKIHQPLNIVNADLDGRVLRFYFNNHYLYASSPNTLASFKEIHQDPRNVNKTQWILRQKSKNKFCLESKAYPNNFLYFSNCKGFKVGKINTNQKNKLPKVAVFELFKSESSHLVLKIHSWNVFLGIDSYTAEENFTYDEQVACKIDISFESE